MVKIFGIMKVRDAIPDEPEMFQIQAGEVNVLQGQYGTMSWFSEEQLRKHLAPLGSPEEITAEIEKARTNFTK
jgi:hypothetical protein